MEEENKTKNNETTKTETIMETANTKVTRDKNKKDNRNYALQR